ncbi:MAG TPA: DNA methyltransferase [Vicinamibacterales bacterium]|nr:DNA methyltransferase [Vicinamibacterales bacterium]
MKLDPKARALNGLCPYFTMFPLSFPLSVLASRARSGDEVLDPFCGRGTTNYAARLLGLGSVGVDASPVAAAITAAKLVSVSPASVVAAAQHILESEPPAPMPEGAFWHNAFHRDVLADLCRLRAALLRDCTTPAQIALRGLLLGALHGPQQRTIPSYFSNQCPRTYAPKPGYAVRYWRAHALQPQPVDVLGIVKRRAERYFAHLLGSLGEARLADSRSAAALRPRLPKKRFRWIITSPPYYGMRTYVADQWLRFWFLGGPETVDYSHSQQIGHSSPECFAEDLRTVWRNVASVSTPDARLVIRFGGIADRAADPLDILKTSLQDSGWRIQTLRPAGTARSGKRQADTFLRRSSTPRTEYDVWARLDC